LGEGLTRLRRAVDALDEAILSLSRARMELCREIGRVKRELGLPVFDPEREREVLAKADGELGRAILEALMRECKRIQWEERRGGGP